MGPFEELVGFVIFETGHDVDDPARAILQLLGAGLNVHHQVAVSLADADHGAGGEHVEHHLGRRAGFQTR